MKLNYKLLTEAIHYGFQYALTSQNDGKAVPEGNVDQWMMWKLGIQTEKEWNAFKGLPAPKEEWQIDKVYKTKFATGENFLVKEIIMTPCKGKIIEFRGIYERHPHLGICPLGTDRLIYE